uniref:Fibronectin type-III domain-containing protein n=2 Tax=Ciona savignyi TaxID=51511 RepID=H2YZL2_CIOSA
MKQVFVTLLAILAAVNAQDILPAPTDLQAVVRSNAVGLTWTAVEGDVVSYLATIMEIGQSMTTTETRAAFGGLTAMTTYTASVVANGGNESLGFPAFVQFQTLAEKPTNLQNVFEETTETMLVISWDMVNGTSGYSVEVATTSGEIISASVDVQGNKAYISGLSPFTFYDLSIRAITEGGQLGDHEEFRARTAGSGIRVNAWWMSQTTFGGEATIFREFVIPPGNFYVAVQLTCPVDEVVVWNANIDMVNSDEATGRYVFVQDETWMRERSEINFNFNRGNMTGECDLQSGNITVDFNPSVAPLAADIPEDTPLEIQTSNWGPGGMVQVKLGSTYMDPGNPNADNMEGTLVAKPVQGTYVIVIDTGAGCPEGITVQNIWEMDQVVNLMDTENPNIMYFIQRVDQWYSNNIGFIFSAACSDRSGLTAVLSKDPSLIAVAFN